MTFYKPGRSKTLSGGVVMGFTFSLKMVMGRWSVEGGRKVVLGPQNCFYWGAAAPQTPRSSWGASSPPDPLAGGLQPPVPPCIPRGSASRALRRSWYQDLWGNRSLHDGGTALSLACNRCPFFTVRTPQASLVGEKVFIWEGSWSWTKSW